MVRGQRLRNGGDGVVRQDGVFTGVCTVRSVGPDHSRRCHKQYVDVELRTSASGEIVPFAISWPDGRRFAIDEIVSVGPVGPVLHGASNQEWSVRFGGWTTSIYLERSSTRESNGARWWVWAFDGEDIKNPIH